MNRRTFSLSALLFLLACDKPAPPVVLHDQELTVACGTCIAKMEDAKGCFWAAEVDGAWIPVVGAPDDPEPHGPEGMCTVARKARVDGEVKHGAVMVTRFDLQPVEPGAVSAPGHQHAH